MSLETVKGSREGEGGTMQTSLFDDGPAETMGERRRREEREREAAEKRAAGPFRGFRINCTALQVKEATGRQYRSGLSFYEDCEDMSRLDRESFAVITLDQKDRRIDRHLISIGTLTAALVHPREVFRPALADNAAAVAFVHNHPSGDPAPSRDDREITARLLECAKLLGFRVLDHVIIGRPAEGRNAFFSFVEEGLI